MRAPGPLIAAGRDADIFEYGAGLVLKTSREGRPMHKEARAMQYVRDQGYPAPAVEELSDDVMDLVMERVEGIGMVAAMSKRPWTIRRIGRMLADLHQRLHELEAPQWLEQAPVGHGNRIVHLDLHPLNVMLSPTRGPVVIDWANASRGDPQVDEAIAWVLVASGSVEAGRLLGIILGAARQALVSSFLGSLDGGPPAEQLHDVVSWKVRDPHMSAGEQAVMWQLVEAHGGTGPGEPGATRSATREEGERH